jgi:hypothetical protein
MVHIALVADGKSHSDAAATNPGGGDATVSK